MLKNYQKFFESKNNAYTLSFLIACYECEDGFGQETCGKCGGNGDIEFFDDEEDDYISGECDDCDGTGEIELDTCDTCEDSKELEFDIVINDKGVERIDDVDHFSNYPIRYDDGRIAYDRSLDNNICTIVEHIFDNPGLTEDEMLNSIIRLIILEELDINYSKSYEKRFDQETKNLIQSGKGIKKFDL